MSLYIPNPEVNKRKKKSNCSIVVKDIPKDAKILTGILQKNSTAVLLADKTPRLCSDHVKRVLQNWFVGEKINAKSAPLINVGKLNQRNDTDENKNIPNIYK